jgi:two-component system response regulator YcbB
VLKPDVVLIDYLMPSLDGVDVIKKVKKAIPDINFVMISQVSDKDMIGDAYREGLSFFISKPINKFEVTSVIGNVIHQIETTRKLDQIKHLIGEVIPEKKIVHHEVSKSVLKDLGIYSEKGGRDIIDVINASLKEQVTIDEAIGIMSERHGEKTKILRQRMRRAINKGLRNLAYLGIEDYMNESFLTYSSKLYDFESVKKEMDYIRGKTPYKGSVSLDRFLDNLKDF